MKSTMMKSPGDCSDMENLNLLTKRFKKSIKMQGKVKNQQSKRYNKKPEFGSSKFTCFGCGKHDHIKVDCPSMTNKDKGQEKKSNRVGKTRRAYIAWEDNDTS